MDSLLTSDEELKSWMINGVFASLVFKKLRKEQPKLLEDAEEQATLIMNKLEYSGLMRTVAATVMKENLTYGGKKMDLLDGIQKLYPQALD